MASVNRSNRYSESCGPGAASRGWLQPGVANELIGRFESGDSGPLSRYQVYQRVFMLSAFELWLRRWEPEL